MRILVCGDRWWDDQKFIDETLDHIHTIDGPVEVVIEGEARGADTMARLWAIKNGIMVLRFHAEWSKYGKAAGMIRNRKQFDEGHPDLVVAFHNDIASSKGTRAMLRYAESKGCSTVLWSSNLKAVKNG